MTRAILGGLMMWAAVALVTAQTPAPIITWPTGTSAIAGIVVDDSGAEHPVRRTVVTLGAGGLPRERSTITDDDGRFEFAGLPAGRFTLVASKPGYLTSDYGARRPGGLGIPVSVSDGERLGPLSIVLHRGAVIAGRVRQPNGLPAPDVQVMAVPRDPRRRSTSPASPNPNDITDDQGNYRIYGLMPGDYVVVTGRALGLPAEAARPSETLIDARLRQLGQRGLSTGALSGGNDTARERPHVPVWGYAPTFYPGTADWAGASTITLSTGQVRDDVDFVQDFAPMAAIEGTVTSGVGDASNIQMIITPRDSLLSPPNMAAPTLATRPGPDGAFKYVGIAPGSYRITARTTPPGTSTAIGGGGRGPTQRIEIAPATVAGGAAQLYATADVTVNGTDISGLHLVLQPTLRLSGRVDVDEAGDLAPPTLVGLTLRLQTPTSSGTSNINGTSIGDVPVPPARVNADGTFEFVGVLPGHYLLRTSTLPPGWTLRSALTNGIDILDEGLDIDPGATVDPLVVTLSSRRTSVTGRLQLANGRPAPDHILLVFPVDRRFWSSDARYVALVRPDTAGVYSVSGLPPGDYWLAAVTDAVMSDFDDATFLEEASGVAIRLSLAEGAPTRQDIRVGD